MFPGSDDIETTADLTLVTFQSTGFDLRIDPWNEENAFECVLRGERDVHKAACRKLADFLGTNQFIWCYWPKSDWGKFPLWEGRVQWKFVVPKCDVLAVVDDMKWNFFRGEKEPHFSKERREKLYEASPVNVDPVEYIRKLELRERECRPRDISEVVLFRQGESIDGFSNSFWKDRETSVLLALPIEDSWVIRP